MFTPRKPAPAALLAAGTLLTAFGLAGCSNDQPQSPPTVVNTAPAPAATTTTTAPGGTVTTTGTTPTGPDTKINVNAGPGTSQGTDQATGEAVNKAIVTNKQMTGSRVEAVVTGGVATLTGSVQNAQQKALAEKAARDTAGVTSVKNKIQINPTGGAKSVSKPPATKVIVVHKTVSAPAPPQPPSPPATPATPSGSGSDNGTSNSMSTGSSANDSSGGAGANSGTSGTTAPSSNGNGQ